MVSPPDTRVPTGILHPCLVSPARSFPLSEAWLTDRQRVGVLLQAAGLLSLLDRAGRPRPASRRLGERANRRGRSAGSGRDLRGRPLAAFSAGSPPGADGDSL